MKDISILMILNNKSYKTALAIFKAVFPNSTKETENSFWVGYSISVHNGSAINENTVAGSMSNLIIFDKKYKDKFSTFYFSHKRVLGESFVEV